MPISGSYYYPGLSKPNSSYASADLRAIGSTPLTNGNGRLYVLSGTGDLYYLDPAGNSVLVVSDFSSSAGYVTGSTNFFVTNNLSVSGSINNPVGHLILSSTAGSVIAVSASIDLVNTDKAHHIRATNGHLILSSSAGSIVYISGALYIKDTLNLLAPSTTEVMTKLVLKAGDGTTIRGAIVSSGSSFLVGPGVLSGVLQIQSLKTRIGFPLEPTNSTFVETLEVSGSVMLMQPNKALLYASGSHMILSSSAGSTTTMSGAIKLAPVFTFATLPASADYVSGSMAYVSDRKCFAVFTPEGWMRVQSGTL